jgi:TatA/E family protein of Tat protein translocase
MFGSLGMTELMVIAGIALLIFGPRQLPRMGKAIGETIREFRNVGKEFAATIDSEIDADEKKTRA